LSPPLIHAIGQEFCFLLSNTFFATDDIVRVFVFVFLVFFKRFSKTFVRPWRVLDATATQPSDANGLALLQDE
jgi:hypothetical protein